MSTKLTKEQKDEALKKVAEVLEEAMAEYEALEKMDLELAEDPARPFPPAAAASDEAAPEEEEEDKDKEDDEDEEQNEDEKDEDKEEEMSDEALKSEYATVMAKMEKRGLMAKSEKATPAPTEVKTQEMKKSETAQTEDLRKSMDSRFEDLTKALSDIAEKVNKIAATPASRKGAAGYTPLKKNDETTEEQPLNKAEVVHKLLDLKKSGKSIPTELFHRIETGRHTESDLKLIKGYLG
jgi:hypothetical protein